MSKHRSLQTRFSNKVGFPRLIIVTRMWTEVLKTLIGTVAGGAITIAALWIKEIFDRRRVIREQFQNYYITEGVDPLLCYFAELETKLLFKQAQQQLITASDIPLPPTIPLTRLHILLDDKNFSSMILTLGLMADRYGNAYARWDSIAIVKDALLYLSRLREALMAMQITSSSDVGR